MAGDGRRFGAAGPPLGPQVHLMPAVFLPPCGLSMAQNWRPREGQSASSGLRVWEDGPERDRARTGPSSEARMDFEEQKCAPGRRVTSPSRRPAGRWRHVPQTQMGWAGGQRAAGGMCAPARSTWGQCLGRREPGSATPRGFRGSVEPWTLSREWGPPATAGV